jgi:glucokinase
MIDKYAQNGDWGTLYIILVICGILAVCVIQGSFVGNATLVFSTFFGIIIGSGIIVLLLQKISSGHLYEKKTPHKRRKI